MKGLFKNYRRLNLKNRFVMAPMTRCLCDRKGMPSRKLENYYLRRARLGFGLIVVESAAVNPYDAMGYMNGLQFHSEKHLKYWKGLIKKIKKNRTKVIIQLFHAGRLTVKKISRTTLAPSSLKPFNQSSFWRPNYKNSIVHFQTKTKFGKPKKISINQADIILNQFEKSCEYAMQAGFDGVEIHGAHGYLIDNFFWRGTNEREDLYGGSINNRSQLATDIVKAIRSNVSDNFIVGLRFSQWKQQDYEAKLALSPESLKKVIGPPTEAGLDYLHSSMRRFWESEFEGSKENLAYWTKKLTGLPTISVGSVGLDSDFIDMSAPASPTNIDMAIRDISNKKYDMVAVGRALLADHEWVIKMQEGRVKDVIPYTQEALYKLY